MRGGKFSVGIKSSIHGLQMPSDYFRPPMKGPP